MEPWVGWGPWAVCGAVVVGAHNHLQLGWLQAGGQVGGACCCVILKGGGASQQGHGVRLAGFIVVLNMQQTALSACVLESVRVCTGSWWLGVYTSRWLCSPSAFKVVYHSLHCG